MNAYETARQVNSCPGCAQYYVFCPSVHQLTYSLLLRAFLRSANNGAVLLVMVKPQMLEEAAGVNHSESSQTNPRCTFLYEGGTTTSSSGYCKAANSWALEECVRKITARLARSVCFSLGIFLPSFSCWTPSWSFVLRRAEEWLHWVAVAFGDE